MRNPALNIPTARLPGHSIHQRLLGRIGLGVIGLFLGAMGFGMNVGIAGADWIGPIPTALGGLALMLSGLALSLFADSTSERMWQGRHGEQLVAQALDHLVRDGAIAFHGLLPENSGFGDIDHVLVHRSGVYLIETKMWNGRGKRAPQIVVRNGEVVSKYSRPCHQARRAAKWLATAFETHSGRFQFVQPVVAMPGCDIIAALPVQTPVVTGAGLVRYIRSQPARLSDAEMAEFARFLRQVC
mgnify:FL=1